MDKKALGKGLSALIPEKAQVESEENIAYIQTSEIQNNSFQPRTNYDSDAIEELKSSIKEKGILQPIIVRKKDSGYEVVAGERRLRALRRTRSTREFQHTRGSRRRASLARTRLVLPALYPVRFSDVRAAFPEA